MVFPSRVEHMQSQLASTPRAIMVKLLGEKLVAGQNRIWIAALDRPTLAATREAGGKL